MTFFEYTLFSISVWRYLSAIALVTASFFLKRLFEQYVVSSLRKFFERTTARYDKLILETISLPFSAFMLVVGLYLALLILGSGGGFSQEVLLSIGTAYWVAVTLVAVWTAFRFINLINLYLEKEIAPKSEVIDGRLLPLINHSLRGFAFLSGILAILASLDVDAGSLLTGLGIGGLAVSLAAQDSLGNFIGSISLLADRPFKVGDWIIAAGGKIDGHVEEIGFRSTRIRSWPKTLVTVPNKLLASEIIDNWSSMPKRRVKQTIGVSYRTTPEQMDKIVENINQMLCQDPGVHQEFILVQFMNFADSSLEIMIYYFTKSIQWKEHMSVRHRVNCNIMRIVRDAGSSMAFPSRSIYFETPLETKNDHPKDEINKKMTFN